MSIRGTAQKRVSWNLPPRPLVPADGSRLSGQFRRERSRSESDVRRVHPAWTPSARSPSPRGGQLAASHRPQVPACLEAALAGEQGSPGRVGAERARALLAGAVASIACRFMIEHPWAIDVEEEAHHFQAVANEPSNALHAELRAAIHWIEQRCGVAIDGPRQLHRIAGSAHGTQGEYVLELLEVARQLVDEVRAQRRRDALTVHRR